MQNTYDSQEAAQILKCSAIHIRRLCKSQQIRACKIGTKWLITEQDLENFIAARQNQAEQAAIEDRSKKKCQSTATNTEFGKYPFRHQAAGALDALLGHPKNKPRKNCTIN